MSVGTEYSWFRQPLVQYISNQNFVRTTALRRPRFPLPFSQQLAISNRLHFLVNTLQPLLRLWAQFNRELEL